MGDFYLHSARLTSLGPLRFESTISAATMQKAFSGGFDTIAKVAEYVHKSRSGLDPAGGARSSARIAEISEHASFIIEHGLPLSPQDLSG